jgi:hypothetical protein
MSNNIGAKLPNLVNAFDMPETRVFKSVQAAGVAAD